MNIDQVQAAEVFDDFLIATDDQIEWLIEEAKKHKIALTNSPNTPELLEKSFDLISEELNEEDIEKLIVIFGRYLGEFIRLNYGGKWTLPLKGKKNVNFNTPVITGHSPIEGLEFAPIRVICAYALRRYKGTIRRAIDNHIHPQILDLSLEAAQERHSKN